MRVGVIGGGQLARMLIAPAIELGIEIEVLGEGPGAAAAMAVTDVGAAHDADAVLAFARDKDVVTFDHEHVPQAVLQRLVAAGVAVRPGPGALQAAQDKLVLRERMAALGLPQPRWARIDSSGDLTDFLAGAGGRAVVKTPRGGYDGKGVRVVTAAQDVADWLDDAPLLAEELVPFRRELAQQVARRPSGETALYPLVETVQSDGVCAEVIAPAPRSTGRVADVAAEIALTIADALDTTGMLAVELFQTDDERLLINELAMRPHNSGHWSMDGAVTGQFEQHLRAVLDLPLGSAEARNDWSVMVNVLGGPADGDLDARVPGMLAQHPAVKLHRYGKQPRPGRKIGHVTASSADLAEAVFQARAAAAFFADPPVQS